MTKTKAVRKFETLGAMMRSFGAPLKDIELARSTSKSWHVYVSGALVGEVRRIERASVPALTIVKEAA